MTGIVQIAGCDPALLTWPFRNYPKAAEARQLVALPLRGIEIPKASKTGEDERERVPEETVKSPETRRTGKDQGKVGRQEPASVRVTPLTKTSGKEAGDEESPLGEIAEEAMGEALHLDPTVTVLKLLAELTAPAPPASGIRAEAQSSAKKKEREEEDEEDRE